jgi:endogenous inhibitor of DNA gyrase (YacG/DUF329 family)
MNRPQRFRTNSANAVVTLDCPFCAAPILATAQELDEGFACSACQVRMDLGRPAGADTSLVAPIAA